MPADLDGTWPHSSPHRARLCCWPRFSCTGFANRRSSSPPSPRIATGARSFPSPHPFPCTFGEGIYHHRLGLLSPDFVDCAVLWTSQLPTPAHRDSRAWRRPSSPRPFTFPRPWAHPLWHRSALLSSGHKRCCSSMRVHACGQPIELIWCMRWLDLPLCNPADPAAAAPRQAGVMPFNTYQYPTVWNSASVLSAGQPEWAQVRSPNAA